MFNRSITAALSVATLFAAPACMDVEETIVSGVTAEYYESAGGLEDAVRASYSRLQNLYGQESNLMLLHAGTDTWTHTTDGGDRYWDTYDPGLSAEARWSTQIWTDAYRAINTTNTVIARAASIREGITEKQRDERVAEVRFLRALYYFYLVRHFGDLHLTLEETQGVVTEAKRTPVGEIYSRAIVPDLEFAIAKLPLAPANGEVGRATRGAAQHLLALVYLTRAAPGDMARSAELSQAVINSGRYSLLPRYRDVFQIENEKSREIIFSVQYTSDPLSWGLGNRWHQGWGMQYDQQIGMMRTIQYGRPFKRLRPTEFLLHVHDRSTDTRYEDGFRHLWLVNKPDPKRGLALGDTGIFLPGVKTSQLPSRYKGKKYTVFTEPENFVRPVVANPVPGAPNVRSEYDGRHFPHMIKHEDPTRASVNQQQGQRDVPVYRLADTYLMAAEALFRDGKADQAVPFVNAVRRRAARTGMADAMEIRASDLSIDFFLDERARELYGEGHRWFDLVRTGKLLERVKEHNPFAAANIQPFHVLRPIPSAQIDRTRNADGSPFGQNPGY